MKLTRLWLLGLCIGVAAVIANGCGGDSAKTTSPSAGDGGGDDGDDDVVVSNACYRSPSDLATYGITCSTDIAPGTPDWFGQFDCVTIKIPPGQDYYVIETTAAPNHKSAYYSDAGKKDTMPPGTYTNPNSIQSQNYKVHIPKTPTLQTSPEATGYDLVGVARNGVAIFNNQAAPGDSLANELKTMDYGNGHPTQPGQYHYHIEPCYLSNDDGNLVGIMRDGFPIFGVKEHDGSDPVYEDDCSVADAESVENCRPFPTQMPNFHCHTIPGSYSYPKCHYHVIRTNPFIIEYYAGEPGTLVP